MNLILKKNKENKKKYISLRILNKVKKPRTRLIILFAIFLFSVFSIIKWPNVIDFQLEGTTSPIEYNLKPSDGGDKIFKFKLAISNNPPTIDPHNAWDRTSFSVIDQVCEGLYKYNLSDPNYVIIPSLADPMTNASWSLDGLNYTVPLRTGVTFHDGYGFKAADVKNSFDRLQYFINASGNLPSNTTMSLMHSEYKFLDGTPIINRTEVINDYLVRFVLNRRYSPFQSLLCSSNSYILSSSSTPKYNYISPSTGDLVGTGPFVFDGGKAGEEVRFHAFDNYWDGKPEIELLYFKIMGHDRNYAILNGSIDYITAQDLSMLPDFNTNPDVKVVDVGNDLAVYYLSMNNNKINQTFRQAISYAINYSYILNNTQGGNVLRAKSPVPPGILFSNWTNSYATYNVTKAREIMQSMGFGVGWDTTFPGTDETLWTTANFVSYNYSYTTSFSFLSDLYIFLYDNLGKIGIDVIDGVTSDNWYSNLFYGTTPGGYDDLDFFFSGWGPDFNDASNMINPLYSNISAANIAQVNDPFLQNLMDQGLNETNPYIRKGIYNEIQKYLVEELMPVVYIYIQRNYDVYRNYVLGYQSNKFNKICLHGITQNSSIAPQKIHINGNQEWIYFRNAEKCNGSGTYSDPYVIKDLIIDGDGFGSSIIIENSTVYFKIENCTIYNSGNGLNSDDAGIKFLYVSNGTIFNNNVSNNNNFGIYLQYDCYNNTISKNIANNNYCGISLLSSKYNIISRNIANKNSETGIYLDSLSPPINSSNYNTILANILIENTNYGIFIYGGYNNTISGNILNDNGGGGYNEDASFNNDFQWNVLNNLADPFNIDDAGGGNFTWAQSVNQLAWVTGSGTYSDPYIIEDLIIDGLNSSSCISIKNSYGFSKIVNCTVYNSGSSWSNAGITIDNVNNSQIINNNAYNDNQGILLTNCNNNSISGNIVNNNDDTGIQLFKSLNNTVSGNKVNNNSLHGILTGMSNNSIILGNIANDNIMNGIILYGSSGNLVSGNTLYNNPYGISLYLSSGISVSGNIAHNNYQDGIKLWKSNNVTISGNTVYTNTQNGINLWGSNNSIISGNTVYDNTYRGIRLEYSHDLDVKGNNVYSNDEDGILSYWGNNNEISGNTANNNNWNGIRLQYASENIVIRNTANNNNGYGIRLENSDNADVIGNILNSNSAGTYYDESGSNNNFQWNVANGYANPIVFNDAGGGDFTWTEATSQLAWFSGSGTSADPYMIENLIINAQNSGSCIEIINSNSYLVIRNSEFTNSGSGTSDAGIRLVSVTTVATELYNVNCSYNNGYGIYLSNCDSVTIQDSTINNNGRDGIALFNSDNNYIENNDATINSNTGNGIYLSGSDNNEINGNIINYNTWGIYFQDSSNNNIDDNDLQNNLNGEYTQSGTSTGNTFGSGNIFDPVPGDNTILIIVIIVVSIIAVVAISGGIALKKRSARPKKVKEKKPGISLEERTAMTILKEEKRKEKQKLKMEEKGRKVEADLLKRMSTVDFLIKEDKFEIALKSLVKIKEEAQTHKLAGIITKTEERIDLCKKLEEERKEQERIKEEERLREEKLKEEEKLEKERLKEEERRKKDKLKEEERLEKERQRNIEMEAKIKEEFEKRIENAEYLIKENKTDMAIKTLLKIQEEAQTQGFEDIVNNAEEKIIEYKKLELETVNRIKQTILTLGAKFTRLQLLDISEKSGIQDEALIENIIHEMIRNKEISGEYFESSKALALEAATPIRIEEKVGRHNVFISYSTLDTDYFQVSKIVRRLELYPEINEVLFWEVDSKQNIVEFMEETLRKSSAFILFCSENSIKSQAVKGEWQSAYQMLKKGLMKIIPVYEDEDHIPRLLWQMLNVKFTPDDFEGFIQKLYEEIIR